MYRQLPRQKVAAHLAEPDDMKLFRSELRGSTLKRTHSDPNIRVFDREAVKPLSRETTNRLAALIRQQPEYIRLVHNLKVKIAFEEPVDSKGIKRVQRAPSATEKHPHPPGSTKGGEIVCQQRVNGENEREGLQSKRERHVRFGDIKNIYPTEHVKEKSSAWNGSPNIVGKPENKYVSTFKKTTLIGNQSTSRRSSSCVSILEKTGIGQVTLQITDFHHPGMTKTLSMNYSSSVLSQNSSVLSKDTIRLTGRKDLLRHACVRRTEHRLRTLRKNREIRETTRAELEKKRRLGEGQGNDGYSANFLRPNKTILTQPETNSDRPTVSEKRQHRQGRILERTKLLPENSNRPHARTVAWVN